MARSHRNHSLETRTSRLKLAIRRKPYPGAVLARGVLLLYRRNKGNGAWVLKGLAADGTYWTRSIAEADDFDEANGETILTFFAAQDAAKRLARGDDREAVVDSSAPLTLDGALIDYKADLIARNASPGNATQPRKHLTAALLAKPVAQLTSKALKAWRDGLLEGHLAPASINRICGSICAALELAAQHDPRIRNRDAWEGGLAALPDAHTARNVILNDETVHGFIAGAYAREPQFGLLIDTLAVSGARPSQAVRLRVEDLQPHPVKPKLMMPKSAKGGGRNRAQKKLERYSVPITPALSRRLQAACRGRPGDAPLLLRANGAAWSPRPCLSYSAHVRAVVRGLGLDPDKVTAYALRHSSIVRMLLKNVPIRLIAVLHDTSVGMIEKNYSAYISEHAIDDITRAGLLPAPVVTSRLHPLAGAVAALNPRSVQPVLVKRRHRAA